MKKCLYFVVLLFLVAGLAQGADLRPQDQVPMISRPELDFQGLAMEDLQREVEGLPYRFAVPHLMEARPATEGVWERLDADTMVWRLRLESPGAVSLNLGFGTYYMPEGGELRVFAADGSEAIRPFTAEDNASHGQLWTPVVRGDRMVVEVTIPEAVVTDLKLELTSFNIGYRGLKGGGAIDSGSCNNDVVCPVGDPWQDEIPSVAVISSGGSLFCTGFMVNNTANDQKPYFMTAYHCGFTSGAAAASLVAYWNYETSSCGGSPNGSLSDFSTGAFLRAAYSTSDFTLMELDKAPDPSFGVTFAGWDATGADATSAVAIHHPSVDEKRISFENDPTTTTTYLGSSIPGNGTHVRVTDWDDGTTEGGSSGSPLFNENHQVIGQLHGGYASCSSQTSDWYGKFSVSWNGGGSTSSSLRSWLDPGNTGNLKVSTLVPGGGCTSDPECDDGLFCNGDETCNGGSCIPGSDPCPGMDCDESANMCVPLVCNNDGTCDSGENCNNCPNDCISGSSSGAECGNGVCEVSDGEDCSTCAADCNGKLGGKPSTRYCCGDTAPCADSRCTADGNTCTTIPATGGSFCCGDGTCESDENSSNCAVDCGSPGFCGDGTCNLGPEDGCSCPEDCPVQSSEAGFCTNGLDDDCNGPIDCADAACASDAACVVCEPSGTSCLDDNECCSNKCKGKRGARTCQ